MAPVLCRPPGDMAPGLEWVFPLCWHPLMQRLRTLQDHILTSPVLSPPATQASPWQAPGRRAQPRLPSGPGPRAGRWHAARPPPSPSVGSMSLERLATEELCWALAAAGCVLWTHSEGRNGSCRK